MKLASTPLRIVFKNVLVASDLSPDSRAAMGWAQWIAQRFGAKLVVTHVISPAETALVPPEYWGSSMQMIDEAAKAKLAEMSAGFGSLPHEVRLEHGRLSEIIPAEIEELHIDLLVLGTHGREGAGRFAMGSVAEELLRCVHCPVVTLGPNVSPVFHKGAFQEILLATNLGGESLAAATYALSLAEEFQARLTLLHVMNEDDFDPPVDPQVALKIRTERLRKVVPADGDLACKPDCIVEFGRGAEQILRVARERSADLIVLGAKPATGHKIAATHTSAATVHGVIARATCPVMTVCI